ncbi:hypothetical protein GXW83_22600 [Streptacidiphilus sp. PB12-B1b]|uniref:hypothetical protein n=1 Tax=Streptacidiphilus sp. PB12-B1b TaxID=2705012 RepID=UPI0015FAE6D2|nr:hypothetical protein [Streptacidiphilus sp. PB12-B1b]QMU78070.1 hypothetical protein GXW83_22600 [Streptacidiphilus sp. PB12-B1b]
MGSTWKPLPDELSGSARRLTEELRAVKDRSGLSLSDMAAATHYSKASWEHPGTAGAAASRPDPAQPPATALRGRGR